RVPGAAGAVTGELDVRAVLDRRDELVHHLDDSSQLPWLEERGVTVVRGDARLEGERRVLVGDDALLARTAVVVAVGSDPAMPPIPGLAEAAPWTNRDATVTEDVPARLVILGGGVVGVEMAQAFSSLGSKVTVLEGGPRLLAREEPFAAAQVTEALERAGIDVRVGTKAVAVRREADGVTVELESGDTVTGDELLVAVGRRPPTDELGLETVGLEPGKTVPVDDRCRALGSDWLYAIGDANGRALLTHMGKYQGRIAADTILGKERAIVSDGLRSPRVIFTEPQVCAVGHTEASAREAGINVRVVEQKTSGNAGGSFYGRGTVGTSRLVVDEDRGVIVGATITGSEVADFLHAATIAVIGEVPLERLYHAVPSFPTRSEVWLNLLNAYGV
ncbi:MAG TPA: NAD(P)/FAD-dependent oxidoreductase, partial [Gaiellaceae bacterium]|nr:NAD(P)/FAD-dependent oxidoreductase [Gaiellaceae bacterium]